MNRSSLLGFSALALLAACGSSSGPAGEAVGTGALAETSAASGTILGIGGKCLDDFAGDTRNGNPVGIWDCNGNPWQDWSMTDGHIVGIGGKCLDVKGGATGNGAIVQLYTCNGTGAQRWQVRGRELVNPQSGRCLDVTGDVDTDGTAVELWDCWNGPNQRWTLPSAAPAPAPVTPPVAPDAGAPSNAVRAADFVQTLGANQHLGWTGTAYDDVDLELAEMAYLGLSHVRDCPAEYDLSDHVQIARAGIKYECPSGSTGGDVDLDDSIAAFVALDAEVSGAIDGIEGPNECNGQATSLSGVSTVGNPSVAAQIQQQLYEKVRGQPALAGALVLSNSINDSYGDWSGYVAGEGDLSAYADLGNWHVYDSAGPETADLLSGVGWGQRLAPGKAVAISEFGYTTAWVDEDRGGRWTVDAWLDGYADGARRMYVYELMDGATGDADPENNFGLFHTDGSAKPAATGIHDLTTLLADPGGAAAASFAPGSLAYSVTGLPSSGRSLLLAKSNGIFDLLVWSTDTSGATTKATVSVASRTSGLAVYDVMSSTTAIATGSSSVTLSLTDRPFVVEVQP
jgi:hypothetical protein